MHLILYFLLLLNPLARCYNISTTNFCKLQCGKDHTVCKRKPCPRNKMCGKAFKMMQLNATSRQAVLDIHNEFRDKIAADATSIPLVEGAKNMNILSYSKELEFVAQCWANNCNVDGENDNCRETKKFDMVGQSVYRKMIGYSTWQVTENFLRKAVTTWYDEVAGVTRSIIDCYKCFSDQKVVEHFTQLAWAKTTHVGCGLSMYGDIGQVVLVCNYGPTGNKAQFSVFEAGKPKCSSCPDDVKCNNKYTGLCGESESLTMDIWTPPFVMLGSKRLSGSATLVFLLAVLKSFLTSCNI